MKQLEADSLKKAEVLRLPFAYSPLDGACISQTEQIVGLKQAVKRVASHSVLAGGAI